MTVRPFSRNLGIASAVIALVVLPACSSPDPVVGGGTPVEGDDSTATVPDDTLASDDQGDAEQVEIDQAQEDSADLDETAQDLEVMGTFTVNNQEYQLHEVRRCIPTDAEGVERELELQARGSLAEWSDYGSDDWVQADIYVQEIAGERYDDVSWSGPEGVFGSSVEPAEVAYSGTMVVGRGTLVDGLTQEETVVVSFMIDVPTEEVDCRP